MANSLNSHNGAGTQYVETHMGVACCFVLEESAVPLHLHNASRGLSVIADVLIISRIGDARFNSLLGNTPLHTVRPTQLL